MTGCAAAEDEESRPDCLYWSPRGIILTCTPAARAASNASCLFTC